jgi:hypothetical protein
MEPKRIDYQVQSTVKPDAIAMTDFEVFIRTNISAKEVEDEMSSNSKKKSTHTMYIYTEVVYDKNEYFTKLAESTDLPVVVDRAAMSDEELVAYLKNYFNQKCEDALAMGIEVDVPDLGKENFSCKLEDQVNIGAIVKGITSDTTEVYYHSNGDKCRLYNIATFAEITGKIFACKYQQTAYCNLLKSYVENEATADERRTIEYGDTPSEEFSTELARIVLQGVTSTAASLLTPNEAFNKVIESLVSQVTSS